MLLSAQCCLSVFEPDLRSNIGSVEFEVDYLFVKTREVGEVFKPVLKQSLFLHFSFGEANEQIKKKIIMT